MDRPGVRQVPEGSGEQGKMEETGCEIICVPQQPLRLRDRYEREKELRTEEHTHQSHKKKFLEHYGQTGTTPG